MILWGGSLGLGVLCEARTNLVLPQKDAGKLEKRGGPPGVCDNFQQIAPFLG